MKYCKKCTMPDTRPGITFDENGVCSACNHYAHRKDVDWDARWKEFEAMCDKYRGCNGPGGYDCAVAVSGGKDSHFQVYMLKEVMRMNPILFSVEDNFPMTEAGKHNLKNISEEFGCTIISCKPNIKAQKTLMRTFFEKYGKPTWYVDRLIYTFPLHMAAKFNTPFLCYGENVSFEYGGNADVETYSAKDQIENGVAVGFPKEELLGYGVSENDLILTEAPSAEELARLDPFYMSYFVPWNSYKNYQIAKEHGFHDLTHEWDRTHHAENFDQIDSRAYLVHSWLKYPKFGHAAATDYTARYIRYGMMTREEAIPIIKERDGALDPLCVRDFCAFCGYTETEFWAIMDKFYNRDLFEKDEYGRWMLKEPIWKENRFFKHKARRSLAEKQSFFDKLRRVVFTVNRRLVMELVPAALETRCLILLPAAPGLAPAVLDYYLRNAAFLAPFEPERPAGFYTAEHHARELAADVQRAAQGTGVRFYLALKDVPGRVIGSVALNNIVRGAFQSCFLGYKLDGALCGRGYMTQAVEACTRFAFGPAALHRVEANVMPRNTASLRVLEKCGYRPEGLARRYLRINGVWEDHIHMVRLNEPDKG